MSAALLVLRRFDLDASIARAGPAAAPRLRLGAISALVSRSGLCSRHSFVGPHLAAPTQAAQDHHAGEKGIQRYGPLPLTDVRLGELVMASIVVRDFAVGGPSVVAGIVLAAGGDGLVFVFRGRV